ncbi:MAG: 30S ribosomal protein S6 [Phycisphaerales bacterium]|nr:30S ribosomal protein S6 [Phycisphaerales bacterium]
MKTYEGMFLLDPALASDWSAAEAEINRVLDRAEAKLIGIRNWDDRRLAYTMGRHKRGLYALSYFQADPAKITDLERDVHLSEKLLRALVLRKDKMTDEDIQKSLAADPPRSTSRYDDRPGRYEDRDDRADGPRGRTDAPPIPKNADSTEGAEPMAEPDGDNRLNDKPDAGATDVGTDTTE